MAPRKPAAAGAVADPSATDAAATSPASQSASAAKDGEVAQPQTPAIKRRLKRKVKPQSLNESASTPARSPKRLAAAASPPKKPKQREYKMSSKLDSKSKYYGVYWHGLTGKWQASYRPRLAGSDRAHYIGLFETEEEAAEARWQYEQNSASEVPVAATSITQLLSGMKPALIAAAPPGAAARPAKRLAKEARLSKPQAAGGDSVKPMSQFFRQSQAQALQQPTSKRGISVRLKGKTRLRNATEQLAKPQPSAAAKSLAAKKPSGVVQQPTAAKEAAPSVELLAKPSAAKSSEGVQASPSPEPPAKVAAVKNSEGGKAKSSGGGQAPAGEGQLADTQAELAKLPVATEEEEALMPRWFKTFHAWMQARGTKDSTLRTYIGMIRLLYEVDRRSPKTMATPEYKQLAKLPRDGISGNHTSMRGSSIKLWTEFYSDHSARGGALEAASDDAKFCVRTIQEFKNRKRPANSESQSSPAAESTEHSTKRPRSSSAAGSLTSDKVTAGEAAPADSPVTPPAATPMDVDDSAGGLATKIADVPAPEDTPATTKLAAAGVAGLAATTTAEAVASATAVAADAAATVETAQPLPVQLPEGIKRIEEMNVSGLPAGWRRAVKATPSGKERRCFVSPAPESKIFWDKKNVETYLGITLGLLKKEDKKNEAPSPAQDAQKPAPPTLSPSQGAQPVGHPAGAGAAAPAQRSKAVEPAGEASSVWKVVSKKPQQSATNQQTLEASSVWKVVSNKPVNVRRLMGLDSELLGQKNPGDQIRGTQVGDWLELMEEPGCMVIKGKFTGTQFLQCCDEAAEGADAALPSAPAKPIVAAKKVVEEPKAASAEAGHMQEGLLAEMERWAKGADGEAELPVAPLATAACGVADEEATGIAEESSADAKVGGEEEDSTPTMVESPAKRPLPPTLEKATEEAMPMEPTPQELPESLKVQGDSFIDRLGSLENLGFAAPELFVE